MITGWCSLGWCRGHTETQTVKNECLAGGHVLNGVCCVAVPTALQAFATRSAGKWLSFGCPFSLPFCPSSPWVSSLSPFGCPFFPFFLQPDGAIASRQKLLCWRALSQATKKFGGEDKYVKIKAGFGAREISFFLIYSDGVLGLSGLGFKV